MAHLLSVEDLHKSFTLHLRGLAQLNVLRGVSLHVGAGECVTLQGPSGAGKSTLIRAVYGNYRVQQGRILLRHRGDMIDMTQVSPRTIVEVRRESLGFVSQFLRVIPRVSTLDIVAEPLVLQGADEAMARRRAGHLLERLQIPEHLWSLPPATFSGGEQQRVNLARVFVADYPLLLLDEPTASLDDHNRRIVTGLIKDSCNRGVGILAIVHDQETRDAISTRLAPLECLGAAA